MIKMIHAVTGCEMWVDDRRVPEFMARGHKLAPAPIDKPEKASAEEMAAVRATVKKKMRKK